MKKILWMLAMLPMMLVSFTSCGSDDKDGDGFNIVGTWSFSYVDDEEDETFSLTFNRDGSGLDVMTYLEKGQTYTVTKKFNYTYDASTNEVNLYYEDGSTVSGVITIVSKNKVTINGVTFTRV